MGMRLAPVFKPDVEEASFPGGKDLLAQLEKLDRIAISKGLKPLSAFTDQRDLPEELPDDFECDPDDVERLLGKWEEWFAPGEGLRAVQGLIEGIGSDPEAARKLKEPGWLLLELKALAACLQTAERMGAHFRLEVT